jgi:hypothetical protein
VCLVFFVAHADSARAHNVTGTWEGAYHCEVGWCKGQDFPATTELYEAAGCADVIGTNGGETITGTLQGTTLTSTSEVGSYKGEGVQTLSPDDTKLEGKGHDSNGTEGTSHSTRISTSISHVKPYTGCKVPSSEVPPAEETPAKKEEQSSLHGTAAAVTCNLDALTLQDTCTATLADTAAVHPTGPTGAIAFSSSSGGFFPFGTSCTLHSSAAAPSTSYCSVQYTPGAAAGFPNISASYAGDATHGPASGSTRFIVPGGEPAGYEESGPGSGYPNELTVEVQAPAPKTEVQAGVDKGETTSPAPAGKHLRAIEDPDIVPSMREEVAEREREERYPDIIPTMRKEVEEREIQYEKDIREMRTEINEMVRKRAGLNAQATEEVTRLVQDDNVLLEQMAEQTASPGLKKDPSSQQTLQKLSKESGELQREIGEVLRIQHQQVEGAARAIGTSRALASAARSSRRRASRTKPSGQLVGLGHARLTATATGKVKLHVRINRKVLARLAHGHKSVKLNLRILMIVPSPVVKSGLPIGMVRVITLHASRHKVH